MILIEAAKLEEEELSYLVVYLISSSSFALTVDSIKLQADSKRAKGFGKTIQEIELVSGFQVVEDSLERLGDCSNALVTAENLIIFDDFYRQYEKFVIEHYVALKMIEVSEEARAH